MDGEEKKRKRGGGKSIEVTEGKKENKSEEGDGEIGGKGSVEEE